MACFIGFGSLVNTSTHRYRAIAPVKVPGWRRVWINNDLYAHAFLSVIPDQQHCIQGLLAQVPHGDWAELDARESGYHRIVLNESQWTVEPGAAASNAGVPAPVTDVQMYVHKSGEFARPDKPILYSYLETVLFGYYQIYGQPGVAGFLQSTTAWTDIKDDRAAPLYPRHVPPVGTAIEIVERGIASIKIR